MPAGRGASGGLQSGFAGGIGLFSRNRRKSIVIDGRTAFVGGLCASSAWEGGPAKSIAPDATPGCCRRSR